MKRTTAITTVRVLSFSAQKLPSIQVLTDDDNWPIADWQLLMAEQARADGSSNRARVGDAAVAPSKLAADSC